MASPLTSRVLTPVQLSSTGAVVKTGNGVLGNIFVASASGTPTITVYDNASGTGNPLVPTFTPVAATQYNFDLMFQKGLNIVLGGTVTAVAGYI